MHALIVDDEPAVSNSLALILRTAGFQSDWAGSIAEASTFADNKVYDVVFVDLNLPDGNGYDCLSRLRASYPKLPILIISGLEDTGHKTRGYREGADDYITKPFVKAELVARLNAVMRRSRVENSVETPLGSDPLGSDVLAKPGEAQSWSFKESYLPPESSDEVPGLAPKGASKTVISFTPQAQGFDGRPSSATILLCGNPKGGTGKTTLAMNLLIALAYRGSRIAALDMDCPQFTLGRYLENRRTYVARTGKELPSPLCDAMDPELLSESNFRKKLSEMGEQADIIVIDSQGTLTAASVLAHRYADLVISPVNDSFVDIDLIGELDGADEEIVRLGAYGQMMTNIRAECGRDLPEWKVLKNRSASLYSRNAGSTAEVLEKLAAHCAFDVVPGLTERVIYRELFREGLTLFDIADEEIGPRLSLSHVAARQEMRQLLDALTPSLPVCEEQRNSERRSAGL